MASPKAIVQIFVTGTRILGKAFWEASKQAVKNAKYSPEAAFGNDAAGATSGSTGDHLTRLHRMTTDEAHLILNVKRGDPMDTITKHYEHLFKVNSPLPKPKLEQPAAGKQTQIYHSHYLQSKIFRALERLEAEMNLTSQEAAAQKSGEATSSKSPPPPPESPPESPHQGPGSQ